MAVFATLGGLGRPAQISRDELHSVADTEDRHHDTIIKIRTHARRPIIRHTRRAARQYNAHRAFRRDLIGRKVERVYLAIDALLSNPPGDELSILRTEIENEDEFVMHEEVMLPKY